MNKVFIALVVTAIVFLVFAAGCQTPEDASSGKQTADGRAASSEEVPETRTTGAGSEGAQGAATESTEEENAGVTASAGNGAFARAGSARASAGDGGAVARAGDVEMRAGDAAADNGGARAGDGASEKGNRSGTGVTVKVGGDRGTRFSGTCAVDGEEKDISGQTPERLVYELDGRGLECEISNPGQGTLNIVVDGDSQRARMTSSGGSELRFTVSESGFSSSTSG